ncbi:hypothetical protein FPV67DRAFT_1508787 [Lyophyllum atratum]|nr:hypothetical protein FPV67DRAFT_1508787 [Lyophyllum atratum]
MARATTDLPPQVPTRSRIDMYPDLPIRMTEKEWAEYRNVTQPSEAYKTSVNHDTTARLRVIGFNQDTKSVLRASNPTGDDYIEVDWSATDIVLWIGQRVEDKIRVVNYRWALASTSDTHVFNNPNELVSFSATFKTEDQVVLTLLTPWDLQEYNTSHLEYPWTKLTPEQTKSSNPRDVAAAEFHLINPESSPHWGTYLKQRKADSARLKETLSTYSDCEFGSLQYETVKDFFRDVLSNTDLGKMEDVMHDCIIPLSLEVYHDESYTDVDAEVLTRIYSPTCPSAVDIYLEYYHQYDLSEQDPSVEFCCDVYYREHREVSKDLDQSIHEEALKPNGFIPMLQMSLADIASGTRGRVITQGNFSVSSAEVASLHGLLFGQPSIGVREVNSATEPRAESDSEPILPLNARISAINMMELLLASVGVRFVTARDNGKEDKFELGEDEMEWTGLKGHERWLGRNLRRVCNLNALEGDDKDSEGTEMDVDGYYAY